VRMRHDDLTVRIPHDVLERARKGGANKVDWYAGRRLEDGVVKGRSPRLLKADHALVLASYRRQRRAKRHYELRHSPMRLFARPWKRTKSHAPPIAK